MHLQDNDIIRSIELLKISGNYTISKLAEQVGLSRSVLYNKFRHLLTEPKKDTEEKINLAITTLQARTGKKELTISSVAKEAGVTRQSISRDYKHLIPLIKGNISLEIPNNSNIVQEKLIHELTQKIATLEIENKDKESNFKRKVFSELMKQDLVSFSANQDKASAIKLQGQVDELTKLHREQMNELSELRSKVSYFHAQSVQNSSRIEILAHLKADYNKIYSSMETSSMMKELFSAEEKNIRDAIEICFSSQPDAIIFFQPFLTGTFENLKHNLYYENVVIIESNYPKPKHFQELIKNIGSIPVHSFSAENKKPKIALFNCRHNHNGIFNEEFIEKLFDLIDYPKLIDGFKSVTTYEPMSFISAVEK
ncbi:AraC family transcriptional regulator [Photobacterium piscicola]|uniref:AraC family transcriptional regulator n=1 Tax=Photobacterium piscicola TaxID=1378299 RepID=UPI003734EB4C